MAFDNVTFFELHLDDARFGGASELPEPEELPAVETSRRGRAVPLGLLVLAGVGAAVTARRMRSAPDIEVDLDEAEAIAVE